MVIFERMVRILPTILALLLTVGGWFAVPDSGLLTGHDWFCSAWIAKDSCNQVRARSANWVLVGGVRIAHADSPRTVRYSPPQAFVLPARTESPVQLLLVNHCTFSEVLSRPVDPPPAFRLGQRPPPHNA
jgi:hypothetical protein